MNISHDTGDSLTSEILARMIIDALYRAGIVQEMDIEDANAIASEEIKVRHLSGELKYT